MWIVKECNIFKYITHKKILYVRNIIFLLPPIICKPYIWWQKSIQVLAHCSCFLYYHLYFWSFMFQFWNVWAFLNGDFHCFFEVSDTNYKSAHYNQAFLSNVVIMCELLSFTGACCQLAHYLFFLYCKQNI